MDDEPLFKLLQLPVLASENVVRNMHIREQYKFALISKRMRRVAKRVTKKMPIVVSVYLEDNVAFLLTSEAMRNEFKLHLRPAMFQDYPTLDRIKSWILVIKELFNISFVKLTFDTNCPYSLELDIVSFLKQEQLKIDNVNLGSDPSEANDEVYKYAMNEFKDVYGLAAECYALTPNFQIPVAQCPLFNNDILLLHKAKWVTIDHVLNCFMNCKTLQLVKSNLFNIPILKRFVRRWMQGSRIKWFQCGFDNHGSFQTVFNEIEDAVPVRQVRMIENNAIMEFQRNQCFMVTQVNGVKAIVYETFQAMHLRTDFSLDLTIVHNARAPREQPMERDEEGCF